jgi:SAM-dependent methyltransferase
MQSLSSSLQSVAANQMFCPAALGVFVNPFYLARRDLASHIRQAADSMSGTLLDIGCGTKPYRRYFAVERYVGLEIDDRDLGAHVAPDHLYNGTTLPFDNATFDNVVSFQVLEHVFDPDQFASEAFRVLKPNGRLLLTVPLLGDEHEQPNDFGRYTSFGLRHLLAKHGFVVVDLKRSCRAPAAFFQLFVTYLFKLTVTRNPLINALLGVFLYSPFTILGIVSRYVLPGNDDFYLDNVVCAVKPGR